LSPFRDAQRSWAERKKKPWEKERKVRYLPCFASWYYVKGGKK